MSWFKVRLLVKLIILYKKNIECSICYQCLSTEETFTTKCNHIFHKQCMDKWCKTTCPYCRQISGYQKEEFSMTVGTTRFSRLDYAFYYFPTDTVSY